MIQRGHHGARGGTGPGRRREREAGYQSASGVSLAVAVAVALAACGGGAGSRPPVPALSSDPRAQEAHARLEEQWAATPPEARVTLEPKLRDYLAQHGKDGRAPWAELRLATLDLARGRLLAAARVAARLRARPPGPVRDLADLVLASAYRRQGRLPEARVLLEALDGKLIDPGDRAAHAEELVRVRIASGDVPRALSGMLAWTESTSAADRELALSTIEALLRTVPDEALERGLAELDRPLDGPATREAEGARRWLAGVLRRRLADLALTRPDAALARRLLATMPPRLGKDEIRDALVALAATSATAASVAGRALGVVLELGDPDTRRRAAELSRGVALGLGLPLPAGHRETVTLLLREAEGPGGTDGALAALAAEGAAVLIAGISEDGARAAARFAEREGIPVLIPTHPGAGAVTSRFAFVLGAGRDAEEAALTEGSRRAAGAPALRVGPGGTPCDALPPAPGEPRFPVGTLRGGRRPVIIVAGDASCAREVALEATFAGVRPTFVLGLEAGAAAPALRGEVFRVAWGLPEPARGAEPAAWYAALGADAARLASAALAALPAQATAEGAAVTARHRAARDALARARAELASTTAVGFQGAQLLPRELGVSAAAVAARGEAP